jgi:class 3 adenylate cyclase
MSPDPRDRELARARARIAELEAQLEELQSGLRLTVTSEVLTGTLVTDEAPSSISSLEEMVLMINPDRTIGYVNAPMARLLDLPDRKRVLGEPLSRWDQGALGAGTLAALSTSALAVEQTVVVEQCFPDLPEDRLPAGAGERPAGAPTLRLMASPLQGRVQITVQDVSRLRWLEETFSRFVSPQVIELMLAQPSAELLAMQRREISMLYADLRGFTRLAQTLPLQTLRSMMTQWFERMQRAVERREGIVGQFVGDQVVALFGAPVESPDHGLQALLTACDMQAAQAELHARWAEQGWPRPGLGIGISTGEVAVGNMGTERMMYYTALGYWMNLGARLCSAADTDEILTIPRTHALALESLRRGVKPPDLPHLGFESRGVYRFKNCAEPTEVLEVKRRDAPRR